MRPGVDIVQPGDMRPGGYIVLPGGDIVLPGGYEAGDGAAAALHSGLSYR